MRYAFPMDASQHILITAPEIVANDGRLLRQATLLREAGFAVSFIAPDGQSVPAIENTHLVSWKPPFFDEWSGLLPLPLRLWLSHALSMRAWAKALKAAKADLIIASAPEALKACGIAGQKCLYDAHEFYEEEFDDEGRRAWVQKTHHRYGNTMSGLITVSAPIAELYAKSYSSWPKAYLFYNVAPFGATAYDGRLHQAAGLDLNTKIVLFHGALGDHRGLERLPAINHALPPSHKLVVLGQGKWRSYLAENGVLCLPPVAYKDLPLWISGAACGLLFYEPISLNQRYCAPNKLFEYAALNIPIVAYDLEGLQSLQRDGFDLQFVDPKASDEAIISTIVSACVTSKKPTALPEKYTLAHQGGLFLKCVRELII